MIEHAESELTPWLLLEYMNCVRIVGRERLIISNVSDRHARVISKIATTLRESVVDLARRGVLAEERLVVLDPLAEKRLEPNELLNAEAVVIGGILGSDPPRGRTRKFITSRLPKAIARNIGEGQMSIDGATYVVWHLLNHGSYEGLQFVDGVVIAEGPLSVRLPYRYPVVNGAPLVAPGLREYLLRGALPLELRRLLGMD